MMKIDYAVGVVLDFVLNFVFSAGIVDQAAKFIGLADVCHFSELV